MSATELHAPWMSKWPESGGAVASRSASRGGSVFRALLLGAIALLPFQITTGQNFNYAPSDFLLALALVVGVAQLRIRKGAVSPWHIALLGVFTTSIFLSGLSDYGLDRYALVNKYVGLIVLSLLYVAITSYADSWSRIEEVFRFFGVAVALQNMLMLVLFFVPSLDAAFVGIVGSSPRYFDLRLCGMLIDPNAYGGLLVVAFAVMFLGGDAKAKPSAARRAFDTLAVVTLMLGIVFTFSRSAWMALAGLIAFGAFRRPAAGVKLAVIGGVALALGLALGAIPIEKMIWLATRQDSVEARVEIDEHAFQMFADNPVLGGGIGAFPRKYDVIIHNTPIWILAELGLVGLIAFVGFAAWFFAKGWKSLRLAPPGRRALVGGLIAAHASLVMLSMGIEALYQRHWWLILALIGAAHQVTVRNRQEARLR